MPKAFLKCVKSGGRVRTKSLSNKRYMKVCFSGDRTFSGHQRKAKK